MHIICSNAVGHSTGSGSALWATAQVLVLRKGHYAERALNDSIRIHWLCIHMHVVVYPRTLGCVSICMWPCIHVHVAMYPCAFGHVSTLMWPCTHVIMFPHAHDCVSTCRIWLYTMGRSTYFVERNALRRILLCVMGHSSEFLYALWTKAQNFVKRFEPQPRMIDHSPESNELH